MKKFLIKSRFIFELKLCGNSSGVEHNLAKVRVASSNLVSRSIIILLLPLFLFGFDVNIYPMYCINDSVISLKTFGFDGEDNEILNLENRRAAKIDKEKLFEILKSNFKTFNDKTGKTVAFVRDCTTYDKIQAEFIKTLSNEYQNIDIKDIDIISQNKLPDNFDNFKLKEISVLKNPKSNGNFKATFVVNDFNIKTLYFRYNFKAQIPVFVAIKNLNRGDELDVFDYQKSFVDFNKFDINLLKDIDNSKMVAKTEIKAGDVLLTQNFTKMSLIKRGDKINATLNDGGLSLIIETIAVQNGNLGDEITVRTKDRKSFKAKIVSKNMAIIQ